MKKYYFIAIFAMVAVVMLQGYSVFLQYKEYVSKTFDLINMQFKISVDEEFAGRAHVEYNPHKDGMQRAYYKVMSDEDFKKANPKKSDVFRYEEINIKYLRDKGVVETESEALGLLSKDRITKKGHPINLKKLSMIFKKHMKKDIRCSFLILDENRKTIRVFGDSDSNMYVSKPIAIGLNPISFVVVKVSVPLSSFLVYSVFPILLTIGLNLFVIFVVGFLVRVIRSKENLLKEREACIHGTVHDLKTPLASVLLLLSFIKDNVKEKDLSELLSKAECQIRKLADTVKTLLITAKAGESKLILNKEKVNLLTLVDNVRNDVEIAFADQPHVFIIKDHRTLHQDILADKLLISNVLRNLIENAVKYSDINTEIEVSIDDNLQSVFVSVKDNGVGIERKYQKKIFEQFFRISSTQHKSGYGIGLALVKYAMKAHGGSVKVESELGKGSTFIISLPKGKC